MIRRSGTSSGTSSGRKVSVMSIYDDPSASSSLGPSAAAMARREYEMIKKVAEEDTRVLRGLLEVVSENLRRDVEVLSRERSRCMHVDGKKAYFLRYYLYTIDL